MITIERVDAVVVITLDRPERRNALDGPGLSQLGEAFEEAVATARSILITGAGGSFCAGADLTTLEDAKFSDRVGVELRKLRDAPVPVVAAVQGAALGLGTQLAAACDLRVIHPGASLGIPAVRLGVAIDHWTMQRIAMDFGFGLARAMLVGGHIVSGADALRVGFGHREGGLDEALQWATELTTRAPLTIAAHKIGLAQIEQDVDADPEYQRAFQRAWSSEDLAEGRMAFNEKRPPKFHGR